MVRTILNRYVLLFLFALLIIIPILLKVLYTNPFRELVNTRVINIPTPTLVPPPQTQADFDNDKANSKVFLLQSLSIEKASYTKIPNTNLEIRIPVSYVSIPLEKDADIGDVDEIVLNYRNKSIPYLQSINYMTGVQDFLVGEIRTSLSPQEWVLDNITYQGIKLRDEDSSVSRGTNVSISGRTFLTLNAGCCGSLYFIYLLPYMDTENNKVILLFGTHDDIGAEDRINFEKNIILDRILSTLRKSS